MTHLLHTSSLLGHIWASRKSILLRLCSGEEQTLQRQHDEVSSTFSFLLYYFSEQGPLIRALRCLHHHKDKILVLFYMATSGFSLFWEHFQIFLNNESGMDLRICISVLSHTQIDINMHKHGTCAPCRSISHINTHTQYDKLIPNQSHSIH